MLKQTAQKVKTKRIPQILGLLLFFSVNVNLVFAQVGKVAGQVMDKKTGETLIGLTVKVKGTTQGVATDVEGRYVLPGLIPGKYTLDFSYIGYPTKSISEVMVTAGKVTSLDVVMEESAGQQLAEVVVTATARQESISGLYAKQKANVNISDGISADQIKRSPDRNTSEVLKRVSGTSVQDNKFVVIRGLSDRYNTTLLNNAVLPSTEPDKKAFSFDIIPSNMIDNIVINKTASPEYPGDFAGGVVQVITKDIPEDNYLSISAGWGYNSQATFNNFELGSKGKYEFLGYNESSRNIPKGIPRTFTYRQMTDPQKIAAGKLFSNSFGVNQYNSAAPIQSYQANLGLTKTFKNDAKVGAILALTYRKGQSVYNSERFDYESGTDKQYDFRDVNNKYSTALGGLANFAFVKGNNKIALKNVYNIALDNSYVSRSGIQYLNTDSIRGYSLDLVSKSLFNTQLEGEHKLSSKAFKLNWNLNYSYSDRLQPDLMSVNYNKDFDNADPAKRIYIAQVPNGSASRTDASRFFSQLFEDSYGGALNVTLPFSFLKEKNSLKAGVFKQYKMREFSARKFGYIQSFGSFNQSLLVQPFNQIFSSENLNPNGFIMEEGTENADKYDATSDVNAAYVQLENKFGTKLRVVWGARVEDAYQDVNTFDYAGDKLKVSNTYLDVMPSLNATYTFNDKTNIRFSASQTVTRPELRELANFGFFDYISKRILQGNPDLKRSQNTNLDLKYEFYPGSGQIISFSGFYKYFKNPIEQVVSSGSVRNITFQNAESAQSYGVEIEFRKRLGFINSDKFFNNLIAYTNASVIFSTVNLNSLVSEVTSRALQGQSPYIINAGLQYSDEKNLSFSLLYNRIGQRIAEVGYQGYPDIYEKGRDVLDFQASKRFLQNKAEIRLNLSDILNQKTLFYQNQDGKKTYDASKDNLMNSVRMGRTASLAFIYNFSLNKK